MDGILISMRSSSSRDFDLIEIVGYVGNHSWSLYEKCLSFGSKDDELEEVTL